MSTDTRSSLLSTLPKDIPASFLKQITNDFSPKLELGKGAFGTVYQGIAENGEMIAVKKLGENCPVADKTFSNEVQKSWTDGHISSKYTSFDPDRLQQIKMCVEIGLQCVEHERKMRPSIADIVEKLNAMLE
ncbi:unnamed protein product [Miscanthus lutarioriparius]|uniref:Protein kinase domain-containing protein n=1 Tax=Miscanthus lutarioriparius TaxID=422564 RepID=A0A811QEE8_9POAL|nr:unnamed protein product [Miscanthus lutarioriparius]